MNNHVIIVGSGPAGCSAAIYTSRAGLNTLVFEGETPGGLIGSTETVDNYLGMNGIAGADMAESFLTHAEAFGAVFEGGVVSMIEKSGDTFFVSTDDGAEYQAESVIYAAGSTPRKLGIYGENFSGVSFCATCDGMFFAEQDVAVVGGGDTAVEDALYLTHVARHVDVFVRSRWKANPTQVKLLESQPNVTIHIGETITSIDGNDAGNPVSLLGSSSTVCGVQTSQGNSYPVTGVFIAVGQLPSSQVAEDHVTLYESGFIQQSDVPGFFVAGDITLPDFRQVAVAVGDGAKAGIKATRYLNNKSKV